LKAGRTREIAIVSAVKVGSLAPVA